LYNEILSKGPWEKRPAVADGLLIFVLNSQNVINGLMQNVPQKHVGIHFGGQVFNFSHSQHKVIVDPSVDAFHKKFKAAYAGANISLYFGVAPW
jgi:hypothetical protein